jgi:hypothetical protein
MPVCNRQNNVLDESPIVNNLHQFEDLNPLGSKPDYYGWKRQIRGSMKRAVPQLGTGQR